MTPKILAVLALSVVAFGQILHPKDVDGWGKIKWGMTLPEVRALYAIEKEESSQYADFLTIKPVQIGEVPMDTTLIAKHGSNRIFLAPPDGFDRRVSSVSLFYAFGLPSDTRKGSAQDFDDIRTLLTHKYGNPSSDENKVEYGDSVEVALWVFPSTSIDLKVTKKGYGLGMIMLRYIGVDKNALDSL
jgi:hypothetical protein